VSPRKVQPGVGPMKAWQLEIVRREGAKLHAHITKLQAEVLERLRAEVRAKLGLP
jgi:hypothetical protein